MVGCLAVFALLVAFDDLTDYDTNYLFGQHVLSMDALKAGRLYRRINSPQASSSPRDAERASTASGVPPGSAERPTRKPSAGEPAFR